MSVTEWRKGKVLWFDDLAGEGMLLDTKGNSIYFHYSALKKCPKKRKTIKDTTLIKFKLYENAYTCQAEEVIEELKGGNYESLF